MNSPRSVTWVHLIFLELGLLCFTAAFANAQESKPAQVADAAPLVKQGESSSTSEPGSRLALPVKPSEIQCSVVEWNSSAPKPTLALLCPPEEFFAPLRVYLQMSWKNSEEVPKNYMEIVAPPKIPTKLNSTQNESRVWLKVSENGSKEPKSRWIGFNQLLRIVLMGERQAASFLGKRPATGSR